MTDDEDRRLHRLATIVMGALSCALMIALVASAITALIPAH